MKNYILVIICFLSIEMLAQKGFYVRPIVEHKFHINDGTNFNITTPQGYVLKVEPINFYPQKGFDIGLYIGYRTKNFFFETGWSQDQGNQGVRVSGLSYNAPDSSFYHTELTYKTGIAYNKIPVKIGAKIFGKDSIAAEKNWGLQGFVYGGLDFLSRQPGELTGGSAYDFITNSNMDTLKYQAKIGTQMKWAYMSSVGFMLKAYNKKGITINLSVHYSQGVQYNYTSYTGLTFTNHDGTVYKSYVSSRSSGLYFSISTDIYPIQLFRSNQHEVTDMDENLEEKALPKL